MADIRSSQCIAQIEWQKDSRIIASQVIAQVEYVKPEYGTYSGNIILELIPESTTIQGFAYLGDISFSIVPSSGYGSGDTHYPETEVSFSLIPESDIVTDIVYNGEISLSFTPESEIIGDYGYNGLITSELIPTSVYAIPIPGFDWYSGYGLVDLTFLDGNPPYYVVYGDVPITVTPNSAVEFYSEYEIEAEGGVNISGEGTVEFETPPVYTVIATNGVILGGRSTVEHVIPSIFELIASGGIECDGKGDINFIDPGDIELPEFELVGSGGAKISGAGIIEFPALVIYEVIASGGIEVNSAGVFEFPDKPLEYEVITSGGVKIGSTSLFEFFVPDVVFTLVGIGGIEVSGESIFVYVWPLVLEVIAEGGVEIGGDYTVYTYHTWVITGLTFEPSIYSNFDFNSYSNYQSKCYGLKDDGLYLLEGDTDDGEDIHTGINLGANNFGNEGQNRLWSIRFGNRDGDDISVKALSGDRVDYADISQNRKATISRTVYGDDIDVSIADFEKLGSIELAVVHRK